MIASIKAYHMKAIQMKYEGKTYDEISRAIGRKISPKTLRWYFCNQGDLYIPYLEYEAKMNEWNETTAKNDIKRQASYAWKIKRSILQKALQKEDLRLANDIINEILDYAGVKPVEKHEIDHKLPTKEMTNEQFVQYLAGLGINAATGLGSGIPESVQNNSLRV